MRRAGAVSAPITASMSTAAMIKIYYGFALSALRSQSTMTTQVDCPFHTGRWHD